MGAVFHADRAAGTVTICPRHYEGTVSTYATLIMRVTNGAGDVGIGNAMTGMDVIHHQMHGPHITHVRGPHRRANSHHHISGANPILTPELVIVVIAVIASVR